MRRSRSFLHIPESMEFITAMPYGYPTEVTKAGGKRRKPLAETAHKERFGERWDGV